jgi:ATP-dependent Clp protease, protease subunit
MDQFDKGTPMSDKYKTIEEHGVFILTDEIDDHNCADAIAFILEANLNNEFKHITLIVNSPGGNLASGFALIDIMSGSQIPVHTLGLGQIASMGLLIFIAGAKGHRTLTPNTLVMSHQWSGERWGKEHELIAQQKRDDIVAKIVMDHYTRHTKLSVADVRKHLLPAGDVYLTANEAKKLGVCDNVKDCNGFYK